MEKDTDINIALNRPVSVSTEQVGSGNNYNPAVHAVDGDNATRWASNDDRFPQWITVDLGQTCDINRFVCNFYNASERAYKYEIRVSETGKENDYTVVVDNTGNTAGGLKEHQAPANTKGRFVTVYFSGCSRQINSGLWEFEIYGPEPAPLPGPKDNLALNQTATSSGNEVAKFSPDKAVDGDATGDSRWSPDKDTSQEDYEAWLQVDLGTPRTVQEIDVKFESEPKAYTVEISMDGTDWETVGTVAEGVGNTGEMIEKTFYLPEATVTRYVRLHQTKQWYKPSAGNYYGGSVYELEVYQEPLIPQGAKGVLETIAETVPTIADGKLVLPESPNENYVVSLYGCDNRQVVTMDGAVHAPLVDMPVNILYQVTNKDDATDVARSETDVKFIVPGRFQSAEGDNEVPNVVPGLREWKGAQGDFTLTASSAIVLEDASASALTDTAKVCQQYFKEMLGRDITVKTGTPAAGDVFLKLDASLDFLGEEGYVLEAGDVLTISSGAAKGILYGGISLT